VTLYFGNQSHWSSTNLESLVELLIPTIGLIDPLIYLNNASSNTLKAKPFVGKNFRVTFVKVYALRYLMTIKE